jgi:diacylglycerol kinase (ATP)
MVIILARFFFVVPLVAAYLSIHGRPIFLIQTHSKIILEQIQMQQGLIVYNPMAGRFPARPLVERAGDILREQGWELQLRQTQGGEDITRLARQAAQDGLDGFFVAGGDGSINHALAGLIGSETALGVLPAGTANVWAQELGLPFLTWTRMTALEDSAQLLANAEVGRVDIGLCNGKPFLLWAGFGLDAYIVHRIEPRARIEKYFAAVQYVAEAAWNASLWRGMNLHVEIDGHKISGHFLLAVISNIHLYAGGYAQISPEARLDDGLMDLWLFEGDDIGDTVQMAVDLVSGKHVNSEQVIRFPVSSLTIESDSPLYYQIDGEPVEEDGKVSYEVLPGALRVFIPPNPPRALLSEDLYQSD